MATWQEHLSGYFGGSKEKYAQTIKEKEARGESFSDPEAAAAFKRDNPQYFSNTSGGSGGGGGSRKSSSTAYPVTKIYNPSGGVIGEAEIRNGTAYMLGTNTPVRDYFSGMNVTWNQSDKELPGGAWGTIIVGQPTQQPPVERQTVPYVKKWEKLINNFPQYQPLSWEEYLNRAQNLADLMYNPQVQAIQQELERQRQAAEQQKQIIESAYSSVPTMMNRLLEEAEKRALSRAIAAGGGEQSGKLEWLTSEMSKPVLEQAAQAEAEKAAKVAAIANALQQYEQQVNEKLQTLAGSKGQFATEYARALQENDLNRQLQLINSYREALNEATSRAIAAQDVFAKALQVAGQYNLTPAQAAAISSDIANKFGQTLDINTGPSTQVRSYVESTYGPGSISYDPATNSVIFDYNGIKRRYPIDELINRYKGQLDQENRLYLPQNIIDYLVRGR